MNANHASTPQRCVAVAGILLLLWLQETSALQAHSDEWSGAGQTAIDGGRPEDAELLLSDPARVEAARCRAGCLLQLTNLTASGEYSDCTKSADCDMCWRACEIFEADFSLWGRMCQLHSFCVACFCLSHHICAVYRTPRDAFRQPPRFELLKRDCVVTWKRPMAHNGGVVREPLVYVLVIKHHLPGSLWEDLVQTQNYSATVQRSRLSELSQLRILAVDPSGVRAWSAVRAASPTDRHGTIYMDSGDGTELQSDAAGAPRPAVAWPPPRLVSLRRRATGGLEALVAWQRSSAKDAKNEVKFEVTWRLIDATIEVTGRLYTSEVQAALPVLPSSAYSVSIREFYHSVDTGTSSAITEPLLVDTSTPDTERRPLPRTARCVRVEVMAGCLAAASVLTVLCVASVVCRRTRRLPPSMLTPTKTTASQGLKEIRYAQGYAVPGGIHYACDQAGATFRVVPIYGETTASVGHTIDGCSPDDGTYFVFDLRPS